MNKFQYIEKEITQDRTAKEVLNQIGEEQKASIMVVGSHGRKGLKEDPTVMGTAV